MNSEAFQDSKELRSETKSSHTHRLTFEIFGPSIFVLWRYLVLKEYSRANSFWLRRFGGQLEKLDLLGAFGWRESELLIRQLRRYVPVPN